MALEEPGPPARKWFFILQSFISSLWTQFLHAEITKVFNWWYGRAYTKSKHPKVNMYVYINISIGVSVQK